MAKTKKATPDDAPHPVAEGEVRVTEDVRSEVYRFLKYGIVSGQTCNYSPEIDKLRTDTIRLFGSNGKSFLLTISR